MGRDRPNDYLILFALWLLVFSASSQVMIVSPMLPQIGAQLSVPESVLGTLVSAYAFLLGVCALVMGPVSDKIGRRRVLLLGSGAMTLALALHSVAVDYASLLAMRALAGAAGGLLSGAAVSFVGDYFPYDRRGWANGWIMSSTALGQILGVPLGTVLAERYGFRTPFLMFAATMAVTFLLVLRFVPQPDVKRLQGSLTVAGALQNYAALLRRRETLAAAGAFCLMFIGLALFVVYLPMWLASTHGATAGQVASLFLVGGVANALTGPLAGRLSDKVGRRAIIVGSCLGLAVVMLLTTAVVKAFWVAYPLFFVTMVLVAARMSPFQALLSALAADERRGTLMSMTVAIGQMGFAAGGAVAGPAYVRFGYWSNTVAAAAAVVGMASLVWFMLPEPAAEPVVAKPAESSA